VTGAGLRHPIHQTAPAHPMRTGEVILCALRWAELQHVGMQMKNLQPSAIYHAADLEFSATLIDAFQPATLMEALAQGLDSLRDAIAISGHSLCGAESGVDVQEKVLSLSIQPADSHALGRPLVREIEYWFSHMSASDKCSFAFGSEISSRRRFRVSQIVGRRSPSPLV
jgi:hypothetical protein